MNGLNVFDRSTNVYSIRIACLVLFFVENTVWFDGRNLMFQMLEYYVLWRNVDASKRTVFHGNQTREWPPSNRTTYHFTIQWSPGVIPRGIILFLFWFGFDSLTILLFEKTLLLDQYFGQCTNLNTVQRHTLINTNAGQICIDLAIRIGLSICGQFGRDHIRYDALQRRIQYLRLSSLRWARSLWNCSRLSLDVETIFYLGSDQLRHRPGSFGIAWFLTWIIHPR